MARNPTLVTEKRGNWPTFPKGLRRMPQRTERMTCNEDDQRYGRIEVCVVDFPESVHDGAEIDTPDGKIDEQDAHRDACDQFFHRNGPIT